jgi:hypothetical protein
VDGAEISAAGAPVSLQQTVTTARGVPYSLEYTVQPFGTWQTTSTWTASVNGVVVDTIGNPALEAGWMQRSVSVPAVASASTLLAFGALAVSPGYAACTFRLCVRARVCGCVCVCVCVCV